MKTITLTYLILLTVYCNAGHFYLTWDDNSDNEDGFNMYRAIGDNGDFSVLAVIGKNITEYSDYDLLPGETYHYYATAFNSIGESEPTNIVINTVPTTDDGNPDLKLPNPASNLSGSEVLTFSASPFILDSNAGFRIYDDRPEFHTNKGMVRMGFRLDSLVSDAALFSRDSNDFDNGGHCTMWVTTEGAVNVRFQSTTDQVDLISENGIVNINQIHDLELLFSSEGVTVKLDNTTIIGSAEPVTWLSNNEPLVIGGSQVTSGDGVANEVKDQMRGEVLSFDLFSIN